MQIGFSTNGSGETCIGKKQKQTRKTKNLEGGFKICTKTSLKWIINPM